MGLVFAVVVWWAPSTRSSTEDGSYPLHFYGVVLLVYALHQVSFTLPIIAQ